MKTTPKDFFLWIAAMIALYVSMFSFLAITFEYINRAYPDALNSYVDPYSGAMRLAIASLAVFFPVFLGLMHVIRTDMIKNPGKKDLWVRRWALYLTLFIAGITVAIDLVTLVNYYLGGDVSIRFALKVAMVLLVALGGFLHFLADLRGYWIESPKKAHMVGWGTLVLVIATIAAGVLIMGTPAQVRLYRFDQQKIDDLTSIQYQLVNYWQQNAKLPSTLSQLVDPISNYSVPTDAQTMQPYTYQALDAHSFKLCATFNAETQDVTASDLTMPAAPGVAGRDLMSDSWWHGMGNVCFTRSIDPTRYPTISKAPAITTK
jgi:hypothetical protein